MAIVSRQLCPHGLSSTMAGIFRPRGLNLWRSPYITTPYFHRFSTHLMFGTVFTLRLSCEPHTESFEATHSNLRLRLNHAFLALVRKSGKHSATLEVKHHYHGWHLVCIDHCYPIIKSPIALNYEVLCAGIHQTLANCNQWPTEEEKAARKVRLKDEERALEAVLRRNRFTIVD